MSEFILLICIYAALMSFLLRNNSVFSSRMQFLFKTDVERRLFDALPSYEEMLYHPKHWGRWTKAQWAEYANRVANK
jgi:hypothetical protein